MRLGELLPVLSAANSECETNDKERKQQAIYEVCKANEKSNGCQQASVVAEELFYTKQKKQQQQQPPCSN